MFTSLGNSISRFFYHQSAGMFFLRLVTGTIFIVHGSSKLADVNAVAHMFGGMGLFGALWWAWFIALLEVIGGAALILGVATRIFGALFAIEMIVAIFLTGIGRGFSAHQFELLLGAASLAIALAGSGRWSAYPMECDTCGGVFCDGERCVLVGE